jgi:DNA polymerase-3 subunit alpha
MKDLAAWENKDVKLAGIVTATEQRLTKNGKPFGRFTLEDYSGSISIPVFGEDYVKRFKNYLEKGALLFVEGTVQKRMYGGEELELRLKNIELLSELAARRVAGVVLQLVAEEVHADTVTHIETLCRNHPGKAAFYVRIADHSDKVKAETISRKYFVNPCSELLHQLQKIGEAGVLTHTGTVRWLPSATAAGLSAPPFEDGTISSTFVLEEAEV